MSINVRLRKILDYINMNIKDFSSCTNLAYRTVQNYLSGDRKPDADGLFKISTHLGINLNWLLTGVGSPFIEEAAESPSEPLLPSLGGEEQELLALIRQSSELGRAVIMSAARGAEKKEAASAADQVA